MAKKNTCKVCRDRKIIEDFQKLVSRRGAYVVTLEEDEFELVDVRLDDDGMVRLRAGDYC